MAMASIYSAPDHFLREASYDTILSCTYLGNTSLRIVDIKSIESVIAMIPHCVRRALGIEQIMVQGLAILMETADEWNWENRVFVAEKPGLEIAYMGGTEESMEAEE